MRRIFREFDFLIALAILCGSSAVAVLAYTAIQKREASSTILLSDIHTGTNSMRLLLGASCPGEFTTTVIHDAVWVIQSSGAFRSSYGKAAVDLTYQAEAKFNPLGQLHDATLNLSLEGSRVAVKLANANPIEARIETTIQGRTSSQQLTIPGPILITRNGSSPTFSVSAPQSSMAQNPSVKALQGFLSHELNLSVIAADQAPQSCSAKEAQRLDLLPLSIRIQSLLPSLRNLIIPASMERTR